MPRNAKGAAKSAQATGSTQVVNATVPLKSMKVPLKVSAQAVQTPFQEYGPRVAIGLLVLVAFIAYESSSSSSNRAEASVKEAKAEVTATKKDSANDIKLATLEGKQTLAEEKAKQALAEVKAKADADLAAFKLATAQAEAKKEADEKARVLAELAESRRAPAQPQAAVGQQPAAQAPAQAQQQQPAQPSSKKPKLGKIEASAGCHTAQLYRETWYGRRETTRQVQVTHERVGSKYVPLVDGKDCSPVQQVFEDVGQCSTPNPKAFREPSGKPAPLQWHIRCYSGTPPV